MTSPLQEFGLKNLRTIHRLDRLTSGLLMFGRNPRKAREMEQQIRNRQVLKEYVCRVDGEFPEGKTECSQPVEVVSYKIGVCKVSNHGKECRTEFERWVALKIPENCQHLITKYICFSCMKQILCELLKDTIRLSFNGQTSVVVCRPFTGRMHQVQQVPYSRITQQRKPIL